MSIRIIAASDVAAVDALLSPRRDDDQAARRAASRIGDAAVARYAAQLDGITGPFEITRAEWRRTAAQASAEVRRALKRAARHIATVARRQLPTPFRVRVAPGISVEQRVRPLDRVGCYVPGGRYPLPSSLLMTAVPARVAGVKEIVAVCARPDAVVLAAAEIAGVTRMFRLGGAQAIAALAFGTATVPRVDRIVGPGNKYVAAAKAIVSAEPARAHAAMLHHVDLVEASFEKLLARSGVTPKPASI